MNRLRLIETAFIETLYKIAGLYNVELPQRKDNYNPLPDEAINLYQIKTPIYSNYTVHDRNTDSPNSNELYNDVQLPGKQRRIQTNPGANSTSSHKGSNVEPYSGQQNLGT